jgi:eukaryotic-like serine/threonine-protein kinase
MALCYRSTWMPADSIARAGPGGGRAQAGGAGARPAASGSHGRYVIGEEIASGGMATVHLGKMLGDAGFARTVAIKRLHPQYAKDPEICAMLLDEGRLAARIHHLNVVTTLDVVASGGELFIVMEYVHGEPVSALIRAAIRRQERVPPRVAAAILAGALRGLHAAHEAKDARGEPLGVVHRDVSPQNILVGSDGVARVLDFGIAKAAGRLQVTQDGRIKGKFGYMPPEQLHAEVLDRRADVYAAGVVLWESLVGARLFAGRADMPDFARLLQAAVEPPSTRVHGLSPAHDAVVMRALSREAEARFPTALAMAEALEACGPVAAPAEVGAWVMEVAGDLLAELAGRIAAVEARLATGIHDSLHLIEQSDTPVTRLDSLAGTNSSTPPVPIDAARASAFPSEPPAAELPDPSEVALRWPATAPDPALESSAPRTTIWPDPLPTRGSTAHWIGAAALGAVAIVATFAIIASVAATPPGTNEADQAPAAPTLGEPLATSAAEAALSGAPALAPAAPPIASIEPAAVTAPKPSATAAASPTPRAAARVTTPTPPSRRTAAEGCAPPFTIDAAGHKHYKRECLR